MWWRDGARALRIAAVLGLAGLLPACFQPLYGDRSVSGEPSIKGAMGGIDVEQIVAANGTPESRMAVEIRNQLVFMLQGGAGAPPPTHRLKVTIAGTRTSVIVDLRSSRPDAENFGLNATFQLIDLRTGKVVLNDRTFSRVTFDVPGQEQRFARARGLRDAENRASQVIAENIRSRLASYFVAGT
jgi:LPS-assembly lipoprotein